MKKIRITNKYKFARFIVILAVLGIVGTLLYNFVVYTEMYLPTWRYQFKNEILSGKQESIELYENLYFKNKKDIFNDNFKIRETYINKNKKTIVEESKVSNEPEVVTEPKLKCLGNFTATAYTIDTCGKTPSHPAYGITSTGHKAIPGRIVAVDPSVIPLGTLVVINGIEYIADDTGGAIKGKRVDICMESISEANNFGRQLVEVYVYE